MAFPRNMRSQDVCGFLKIWIMVQVEIFVWLLCKLYGFLFFVTFEGRTLFPLVPESMLLIFYYCHLGQLDDPLDVLGTQEEDKIHSQITIIIRWFMFPPSVAVQSCGCLLPSRWWRVGWECGGNWPVVVFLTIVLINIWINERKWEHHSYMDWN